MTDHAQGAREIANRMSLARRQRGTDEIQILHEALTQAHAQGRREGLEECADLIEVQEIADPSGLSRKEQLRIYDIIQKLADMCRAKAKEVL